MITSARREEYERIVARVTAWASGQSDIVAVALVGSWARERPRMDSDIDLVVLTTAVDTYVERADWIPEALGEPGTVVRTQAWGVLTERRVRLASGLEIEFGFAEPAWASTAPVDPGTAAVVHDGCHPLHDPTGRLAALLTATPPTGSGPLQTPR